MPKEASIFSPQHYYIDSPGARSDFAATVPDTVRCLKTGEVSIPVKNICRGKQKNKNLVAMING